MSSFVIERDRMNGTDPTTGVLTLPGGPQYFTLELPWKDNQPGTSCIPVGVYSCLLAWSNRFQRLMPRLFVPGRQGILIHSLNWVTQTEGCVGVGMRRAPDGSLRDSRKAFKAYADWLGVALKDGPVEAVVIALPTP